MRKYEKNLKFEWRHPSSQSHLRKLKFGKVVKIYAKVDIKVIQPCPILPRFKHAAQDCRYKATGEIEQSLPRSRRGKPRGACCNGALLRYPRRLGAMQDPRKLRVCWRGFVETVSYCILLVLFTEFLTIPADIPRGGFELAQNPSSNSIEWSSWSALFIPGVTEERKNVKSMQLWHAAFTVAVSRDSV